MNRKTSINEAMITSYTDKSWRMHGKGQRIHGKGLMSVVYFSSGIFVVGHESTVSNFTFFPHAFWIRVDLTEFLYIGSKYIQVGRRRGSTSSQDKNIDLSFYFNSVSSYFADLVLLIIASHSHLSNMAFMLLIFLRLFFVLVITQGSDFTSSNITLGSSLIPDTNPSWRSPSGLFAFGFYRQDDGFAVGIWLASKSEITVVWTANRDDPPVSTNSSIELTGDGWLLLHTTDGEDKNITSQSFQATSASILDSGGQKLAIRDQLVSSVSASQHTSGKFFLRMQDDGNLVAYPLIKTRGSDDSYWSSGTLYSNYESLNLSPTGSLSMVGFGVTERVLNSTRSLESRKNVDTVIFRATLNWDGNFVLYSHRFTSPSSNLTSIMKTEWAALQDPCDAKGICGFNSYCSSSTSGNFQCHCFPGFLFVNGTRNVTSNGCYRNFTDEEACNRKPGLQLSYNITVLDNMMLLVHYAYSSVMNLSKEGCRQSCWDDCNCWAGLYAEDGSCKKLKVPIVYAVLSKSRLTTVFIKTSFPYKEVKEPQLRGSRNIDVIVAERKKLVSILGITLGCIALMCSVLAFSAFFFYRVHAHRYQAISETVDNGFYRDHFSLRAFSFDELQKATDGFKEVIGRNSYGEVYKGFISDGSKAVAVKRLERMFEGEGRFRAEITAIAQTHHRNLVRLLGFCIQGATKLLVYEFMSNGSLEDVLFNAEAPPGWKERVRVPLDVARGILYLHDECEARIIHCNIKPHNILFDEAWTAKISDFGLSKLLRSNQSGTLLSVSGDRDRGTRGYLAPEWHKNTLISTKVDIYSFGVVLLEILCCRNSMEIDVLSTWVYNCFIDKDWSRLTGDEEVDVNMLEKMVKVGLLCIQDDPDARPSIKNVILMLEGTADIPIPPSPTSPHLI
ncbi:G-type lectin S-receptor-like serine/threonine-protein kinase LECRK2 isoform X2 [Lactuca sativa]|uniref:G-type lectin S-receptor-like serine/threonine-protein kinase LECRK2 isoform X2 n=1 Tax=Lactuca sativa TaxID=4236 RepID=UPI001C68CCDF|nr:G-type lectin S-receptor-like serine/threonine-protein kinase LECRK2 isoform X2 [Lactuca sativa]